MTLPDGVWLVAAASLTWERPAGLQLFVEHAKTCEDRRVSVADQDPLLWTGSFVEACSVTAVPTEPRTWRVAVEVDANPDASLLISWRLQGKNPIEELHALLTRELRGTGPRERPRPRTGAPPHARPATAASHARLPTQGAASREQRALYTYAQTDSG